MNTKAPQQAVRGDIAHRHVHVRAGRITARQTRAAPQAGFQLVEVLIALAIVAVVGAIAIPSYSGYRERADFAIAETDISVIVQTIEQFFLDNKSYPNSLDDIGSGGKLDPWGNTYYYLRIEGANLHGSGAVRKDKNLVPVNSDYDLYSAGKDGQTKPPFTAKASRDDIVRASNGRFIGYAVDF